MASEVPPTPAPQIVVSEVPEIPQTAAAASTISATLNPPTPQAAPVNLVPESIQLPAPIVATVVNPKPAVIEAVTPPVPVVPANPEPVAVKAPPVTEEPAPVKAISPAPPALVEPEPVAVKLPELPLAAATQVDPEPEVIKALPVTEEPAPVKAISVVPPPLAVVEPEPVAVKLLELLLPGVTQADPELLSIEAEVAVDEDAAIEAIEPPPAEIVDSEPVTIESPEPVDLSIELIEDVPLEAIESLEPVAPAIETTPLVEETPLPVALVDPEPVAVEEPAPETSLVELALPEPVTVESVTPPSVAAVEPELVVVEEPAAELLSVELAQPEQVTIESITPTPVAAMESKLVVVEETAAEPLPVELVQPGPVSVESISVPAVAVVEPQLVAIEASAEPEPVAVDLKPITIEPPAPSSAAEKNVAVEAEVKVDEVVQETEEAEEEKETMKPEAAKSGTIKFNFTEKTLPSYLSNPDSIEDLVPWLSFKCVGTGDLPAALAHLGFDGSEATAMNVLKMKDVWAEEYRAWNKRDLRGKRYVYMWADGLDIGGGADGVLVIMGAGEKGERELIAVGAGQRENPDSWIALLADMKSRGLTRPPKLFIGDAKLGLWKPLTTLSPTTRKQSSWAHKSADVLKSLPKTLHPYATAKLEEITMAARRDQAIKPLELFAQICSAESPEAAQCLLADKDTLLTFHDFPAEHRTHLRNTSAIGGIFDTLDLKNYSAEGPIAREQAIMMAFKLAQSAQKHWRKLSASPLLTDVLRGVAFIDGVKAAA